jgi:hypothetical protein
MRLVEYVCSSLTLTPGVRLQEGGQRPQGEGEGTRSASPEGERVPGSNMLGQVMDTQASVATGMRAPPWPRMVKLFLVLHSIEPCVARSSHALRKTCGYADHNYAVPQIHSH